MVSLQSATDLRAVHPDMAQWERPKSPAEEEASKVAFADAFVQRPEFVAKYGGLTDRRWLTH